jgi:hypothetical protein
MKSFHARELREILPQVLEEMNKSDRESNRGTIELVRNFFHEDGIYDREIEQKLVAASEKLEQNIRQKYVDRPALIQDACKTSRDFSDRLPPSRWQGNIGWCYANAAADLVLLNKGIDISPLDLALNYINDPDHQYSKDKDGGFIDEAISASIGKGFCPSEERNYTKVEIETLRGALATLKEISVLGEKPSEEELCEKQESLANLFPGLSVDDLKEILSHVATKDIVDALRKKSCHKRGELPDMKMYKQFFPDEFEHEDVELKILDELSKGKGVGVGLNNLSFLGIHATSGHAVVIIGNRLNPDTGQCDYIIRNSWGQSCLLQPPGARCENGNWVVSGDLLQKQNLHLTIFKD